MKTQYSQPEASAEANLLATTDFCLRAATDPKAVTKMSLVQALSAIYDSMTSYLKQYPDAARQSTFVGYWGQSVSQYFDAVIAQVIAQDPKLQHTDWHRKHFDLHLQPLVSGEQSIPAFMGYLDANRATLLNPQVSSLWNSAARQHHEKHKGDCNAGGGCPSTACAAKAIMASVAAKKGAREAA